MLGRATYTREELDHGKAAVAEQLAAYKTVKTGGKNFEWVYFNNMLLVLDRLYVHRVRGLTGKDTNPINEVELLGESLMNHDGVLTGNTAIKYVPEQSVLQLKIGDPIRLTAKDFTKLSSAFLAELEERCR